MDFEVSENIESPKTPSTRHSENDSNLDHSDNELEIDLSNLSPVKSSSPLITHEQVIIESIEEAIGKQLDEKAEKNNLTVTNVKSIIRQVLTNEHVRALFGKESDGQLPTFTYEPKLTRAKAKELLSATTIPAPTTIPWVPQPPPSETHVLIGEDLKEDDSGDEYIPGEEESEDDKDESVTSESDIGSLPPPTPPSISTEDQATQTTNYTEDGVFKIPLPKTEKEKEAEEAANIALRTRSKINLSATPLEAIEQRFVFPDIPTDMYENIDCCDDEEWTEFLKGFTVPLEEVTIPKEDDEEHDPEYNILADDEINHIDKEDYREDFRVDKAVKITKKEVKELWEELFEYLHNMSGEYENEKQNKTQDTINEGLNDSLANLSQITNLDETNLQSSTSKEQELRKVLLDINLSHQQICVIEQQMRQHVQMLTQNFFLTYEHPEFHSYSLKLREYLLNLKFLSGEKSFSMFRPVNLIPALKLIESWIELLATNSQDVWNTREHVRQQLLKSIQQKMAGNWNYVLTFPKLILETIINSEVFLYPSLLPKIPFRSAQFSGNKCSYTDAEDNLLVFGLDMFKTYLTEELKLKKAPLKHLAGYVQQYMMPHRTKLSIFKHILQSKHPRCATNPIQQYVLYGTINPVVHYIYPLNQITPPCKRPDELPLQWRTFLYSYLNSISHRIIVSQPHPSQILLLNCTLSEATTQVIVNSPVEPKNFRHIKPKPPKSIGDNFKCKYKKSSNNKKFKTCISANQKLAAICLRPISIQKLVRFLADLEENNSKQIIVIKPLKTQSIMNSMNMPNLNTPLKNIEENIETEDSGITITTPEFSAIVDDHKKPETITLSRITQESKKEKVTKNLEFSTITSSSFQTSEVNTEVEFCRNSDNVQICQTSQSVENVALCNLESTTCAKDSPKEINAPMEAGSILKLEVKPFVRKELSGAEKKRIKVKKDFLANLSIATPEDPETEKHKNEMFAMAYYDKLRETLKPEDYQKIIKILNDFVSGDVVDLYHNIQAILCPNYMELAEEFLFFLREKEASIVGKLIPWMELQARVKFLRKLEIIMKDQPAQIKKIYNSLLELTKTENLTMEKVKSTLVPMFKGNAILYDLFIQNFKDERPPPSLLEGPYETIDINKEMARPDNEELYETFVVPNTEDKYGGQNCICHCHKIEDNKYKSRYKHCNACGLKFANGKLYLSAGRIFQPATITFKTSPDTNHNLRLMGKLATTASHRKKRSETSPNKLATSSGKENLEEDTEDEELGKRKRSVTQKKARKRKKTEEISKTTSSKKSPGRSSDSSDNIKPRKCIYSGKRTKKDEIKITETTKVEQASEVIFEEVEMPADKLVEESEVTAEVEESEHETSEEHQEKTDDCMDSSGESIEKPLTPGQQTAESESEVYLEESSQDNYESDDSSSSTESTKGSQSDNNTNDEQPWKREEDTIILETLQKEDDKEYALQIISDKLPNRTIGQIRSRLSRLMDLLIETLKNT